MLELYQTEWRPASRRVRQRLTELGIDYIAHQVPVEKPDRVALQQLAGTDTIPALALHDGSEAQPDVTAPKEAVSGMV
jgi:glutathione S-transferase